MTATASQRIAEYVASVNAADVSADGVYRVARAFVDTHAVCVAARRDPLAGVLTRYAPAASGDASHWAEGARRETNTEERAALVNGAMAHVLDYDDVTSPLRGHPSVAMLPALVALAETEHATGRQVSAAYQAGFEVMGKLGKALAVEHYAKGWHATTTIGLLGATAAACQLLRLDPAATRSALGIAVAQAGGTRQNFGTMAKSFQVGACAAGALRAARLAAAGLTAAADAIDGDLGGFVRLYCGAEGPSTLDGELASLGAPPTELWSSGIDVKKYPLCYATHRAIDLILDLRAESRLTPDRVAGVQVRTNRGGLAPLLHHRPQTGLEAKFSIEYAAAAALFDGRVVLGSFDADAVSRPAVQSFLPRVQASEDTGATFPRWTEVAITTTDGDVLTRRTERLHGSAVDPLSDDELIAKVEDCYFRGGFPDDAERFAKAAFGWSDRPMSALLSEAGGGR